MTRNKTYAARLAIAFALCVAAWSIWTPSARAQGTAETAPPTQKIIKTHYVVLQMSAQTLQVHSATNERELHTFTFSPEVRVQMQDILKEGGYHYGDKVVIWHKTGDDVAVKIKGKPSKPK